MHKNGAHSCDLIDLFLEDPRIPIYYDSTYREYYIPLLKKNRNIITAAQCIDYCPWCGTKLPKSVREEWFDILEKEYGIDHPRYDEQEKLIPEEFKTDEWWKKRGL